MFRERVHRLTVYTLFEDTSEENCRHCNFSLHLTKEEERVIEGRLSGADSRQWGVDSASDDGDGEVPGRHLLEELKEAPVFAQLGLKSLVKVASALERRSFRCGATIVKQGDRGDSFYILRSGHVKVVLEKGGDSLVPVAELGPNDGFGEMALLTGQPRSATVVALTDVEAWRLPKVAFALLLSEHLSLALYFSRIVSQRLAALQAKIVP